jgi:hypothetical protein
MVNMKTLRVVLFLLVVWIADADTVTTRDSSSWNGSATISGGIVRLVALFRTGKVTLQFGANYVRSIDFNSTVYNPGQDPSSLLPKPTGGLFSGTIYLQNKTNQRCGDITFASGQVSCDGKAFPGLIRIVAGKPQ